MGLESIRHYASIIGSYIRIGIIWKAFCLNSKNLRADLLRMQGIISISQVTPSRLYILKISFSLKCQNLRTLDYMHVKAGLNNLAEQMH